MVSNKRLSTATVKLVISDMSGIFESAITLADGTPLTVKVGRTLNDFETYSFRVFNFHKIPAGGVSQYTIIGYWDSPAWFFNTTKKGIRGTSSDVIAQIADACGLDSDVDPANDTMLWLPSNARNCVFARNINQYAIMDDQSFFVLGQTLSGQIRHWNLNLTAADQSKIPHFVHGDTGAENTYMVYDHKNIGASGFGNAMGGYMHNVREQSVVDVVTNIDSLNVKRLSQQLLLNKDIRTGMEAGRVELAPVNCGNVHDQWNLAKYQNGRNSMIYSLGVELLLQEPTVDFDLFDEFYYQATDPPGTGDAQTNKGYKGVYIATAKAIHVEIGNYFEKVQGYTTGLNDDADDNSTQE